MIEIDRSLRGCTARPDSRLRTAVSSAGRAESLVCETIYLSIDRPWDVWVLPKHTKRWPPAPHSPAKVYTRVVHASALSRRSACAPAAATTQEAVRRLHAEKGVTVYQFRRTVNALERRHASLSRLSEKR
eukprot:scaffold78192_cov97-Phaeocystis_antarctica.AAC.1